MNDIPEDWVPVRAEEFLVRRKERARGHEELLSATRNRGVILQSEVGRRDSSSEDKSAYWIVHSGDIVYNTMRMWQGVSGISKYDGIVSPAYTVCRVTENADPEFIAHLFRWRNSVSKFYQNSQGLVSDTWNLQFTALKSIEFVLPPLDEQRRISNILNAIANRIEKVQELIKKHSAVEAGLLEQIMPLAENPGIPAAGWRLSVMAEVVPRAQYGISESLSDDQRGIPTLRMNNLNDGIVVVRDVKYSGDSIPSSLLLRDRDVLFNRTNSMELVGKAAMWRSELPKATFASYLVRLHCDTSNILPEYLTYWLNHPTVRRRVRRLATPGVQQVNVNPTSLRGLEIELPGDLQAQEVTCRNIDVTKKMRVPLSDELSTLKLIQTGLTDDLLSGRVRVDHAERIVEDL